jgi:hypothetical protein
MEVQRMDEPLSFTSLDDAMDAVEHDMKKWKWIIPLPPISPSERAASNRHLTTSLGAEPEVEARKHRAKPRK